MVNPKYLDIENQTYCALELAMVEEFTDAHNRETVSLDKCAVVEVAAVKIVNGRIQGHFHSFVAIDGYDAHDIEIVPTAYVSYSIGELQLIGAPSFDEVIKRLRDYVGDSAVLVNNNLRSDIFNPLFIMRRRAQEIGCAFDDNFIRIKDILEDDEKEKRIQDIFLYHDVSFDPFSDSHTRNRNDALSWALAYAKLFINVAEETNSPD